jgi:hypothetical protein
MYAWIWRHTPGPAWLRSVLLLLVFVLLVLVLFTWVFPWVETRLPFTDVTVNGTSSG